MSTTAFLFPLLLAQAAPATAVAMLENQAMETPKHLWYAASRASGVWYCDRSLKGPQARRFEQRYGKRVLRLATAMRQREGLGWEPDDIIVSVCDRETRAQRAKALVDFETQLSAWEAQYLPTNHPTANR